MVGYNGDGRGAVFYDEGGKESAYGTGEGLSRSGGRRRWVACEEVDAVAEGGLAISFTIGMLHLNAIFHCTIPSCVIEGAVFSCMVISLVLIRKWRGQNAASPAKINVRCASL